jgi:hypothetical protein
MDAAPARFGSPLAAELAGAIGLVAARCADGLADLPASAPTPTPAIPRRERLDAADGASVEVTATGVVIGRTSSAGGIDLGVDGPTVSRRHVFVWRSNGATLCRDLGSRNRTFRRRDGELHEVPGPTGGPTLLQTGDELVTADGALLAVLADVVVDPL